MDIDVHGCLVHIESLCSRSYWQIDESFLLPQNAQVAEIKFITPHRHPTFDIEARYTTNEDRSAVHIQFNQEPDFFTLQISHHVYVDVSANDRLRGLWICDFIESEDCKQSGNL